MPLWDFAICDSTLLCEWTRVCVLDCVLRDPRSIHVHIQYVRMNPRDRLGTVYFTYHHSEDPVFIWIVSSSEYKHVAVEAQRTMSEYI